MQLPNLLWHIFGIRLGMKVLKLKTDHRLTATEKFIKAILQKDIDAFKATSRQFLRNNQAYSPNFTGLIA